MKLVAIILALLIGKAGIALPISSAEMMNIQDRMAKTELSDNQLVDCEDDIDDCDGCCDSGQCNCISIGGFTMTSTSISYAQPIEILHHRAIFSYQALDQRLFPGSLFQPPKQV